MTKTWCVGGRHYSNITNKMLYEKVNLKAQKLVEIIKGTCSICGLKNSQNFIKQMTRAEKFLKNAKCKHGH